MFLLQLFLDIAKGRASNVTRGAINTAASIKKGFYTILLVHLYCHDNVIPSTFFPENIIFLYLGAGGIDALMAGKYMC